MRMRGMLLPLSLDEPKISVNGTRLTGRRDSGFFAASHCRTTIHHSPFACGYQRGRCDVHGVDCCRREGNWAGLADARSG